MPARRRRSVPSGRSQQGMVLVQMALVMPILVLMFSAIVQFGGIFFLQNQMVNAARDASRRLAVGDVTPAQAESLVQAKLASWPYTFTVIATQPDGSDPHLRLGAARSVDQAYPAGLSGDIRRFRCFRRLRR